MDCSLPTLFVDLSSGVRAVSASRSSCSALNQPSLWYLEIYSSTPVATIRSWPLKVSSVTIFTWGGGRLVSPLCDPLMHPVVNTTDTAHATQVIETLIVRSHVPVDRTI